MPELYLYGAGGHGKVVFHAFASQGKIITAFIDDQADRRVCGLPVLSPAEARDIFPRVIHVAIGNNQARHDLQTAWECLGVTAATAIHGRATVYFHTQG
ncbi:hypothetical protein [Thiothrix nivea]|uniref:PglD-related sugar-binding protein n=1 Tax=Thiothrix nivea TaxID=1031 RepID=UPI0002DF1E5B|nr:hypothetical protein [Thiothrix nivea]